MLRNLLRTLYFVSSAVVYPCYKNLELKSWPIFISQYHIGRRYIDRYRNSVDDRGGRWGGEEERFSRFGVKF
jgi:hypothetical protein